MATLKLKKPTGAAAAVPHRDADRTPVRGHGGSKARPTLAQAQAERIEREARYQERYQEQVRQRFGDRPPEGFTRRDERSPMPRPAARSAPDKPSEAYNRRDERPPSRQAPASPARSAPFFAKPGDRPPMRSESRGFPPAGPARPEPARNLPRADGRPSSRPNAPTSANAAKPVFDPTRNAPRGQAPGRSPFDSKPRPSETARPTPSRTPLRHPTHRFRDNDDDDNDQQVAPHAEGSMRLSKRMSQLGIASRREADEWIAKGWVRVDDQVVSELGSRVVPGQRVTVDAKAKYQQAQRVTVLINKPVGIVSGQAEDGYEPALVLVTPANLWAEDHSGIRFLREHLKSLVPAGRLDIDSVGLLVLTQDGRIARQLIGEDSEVEKEYLVRVAHAVPRADETSPATRVAPLSARSQLPESSLERLRHGLELDGEPLLPAQVEWVNDDQLRFVLRQGKKRQIRRMCEAVGLQVLGLKRVRIGGVMLGDLPTGQWRYLRRDEAF